MVHFRKTLPVLTGMAACLLSLSAQAETMTEDRVKDIVRKYIMDNPKVILQSLDQMRAQEEEERRAQQMLNIKKNIKQLANEETSPVLGNPKGDVTVVEFFDYNCGYCKRVLPTINRLIEEDKNVRVVMKEFPILSPQSELAAKIAQAVWFMDKTKYMDVHSAFMKHSGAKDRNTFLTLAEEKGIDRKALEEKLDSKEVKDALEANQVLGRSIGIRGTPAFVVGTELVPGAMNYESLAQMVAEIRAKKK